MKVYVVTYDYKDKSADYSGLFNKLKTFKNWWHYIKNTWLIKTDKTAEEVFNYLRDDLDDEINLLVIEAGSNYQGWLPDKAWSWIKKHLPEDA